MTLFLNLQTAKWASGKLGTTGIFDSEATELADAQCAFAEYATIMQGKVERAAWEPRAGGPNFGPRNSGPKYARQLWFSRGNAGVCGGEWAWGVRYENYLGGIQSFSHIFARRSGPAPARRPSRWKILIYCGNLMKNTEV